MSNGISISTLIDKHEVIRDTYNSIYHLLSVLDKNRDLADQLDSQLKENLNDFLGLATRYLSEYDDVIVSILKDTQIEWPPTATRITNGGKNK